VVVEGAGGWLVPIRADYFVSDLAAEMKLPVLVVAQNRLGCLNHTAAHRAQHRQARSSLRGHCLERIAWRD
jgi:dethiobiotin synthetase